MALREVPEDELQVVERIAVAAGCGGGFGAGVLGRGRGRGALVARLGREEVGLGSLRAVAERRVEVDRDEEIGLELVGERRARGERQLRVLGAGEHRAHRQPRFERGLERLREEQRDVLLLRPLGGDRSGLAAPVAGVDHHHLDAGLAPRRRHRRRRRGLRGGLAEDVEDQAKGVAQSVVLAGGAGHELDVNALRGDVDALHQRILDARRRARRLGAVAVENHLDDVLVLRHARARRLSELEHQGRDSLQMHEIEGDRNLAQLARCGDQLHLGGAPFERVALDVAEGALQEIERHQQAGVGSERRGLRQSQDLRPHGRRRAARAEHDGGVAQHEREALAQRVRGQRAAELGDHGGQCEQRAARQEGDRHGRRRLAHRQGRGHRGRGRRRLGGRRLLSFSGERQEK